MTWLDEHEVVHAFMSRLGAPPLFLTRLAVFPETIGAFFAPGGAQKQATLPCGPFMQVVQVTL